MAEEKTTTVIERETEVEIEEKPADDERDDERDDEPSDADKLAKKLNEATKRARQAEKKVAALEQAGLSEQEQKDRKLVEAEARMKALAGENRTLKAQFLATKAGMVDAEAASKLLDWDELGDDPDRDSINRALADLGKKHTFLLGKSTGGGADGGDGRRESQVDPTDMNAVLRGARNRR